MTGIVQFILGLTMLLAGRKLFWLFVGAVGFVIGMALASRLVSTDSELLLLIIALAAGILGAVLARVAQNLAVGLAGFLAGGYAVEALFSLLNVNLGMLNWLFIIVGAVLGAILVGVLFEWALIFLSSFTGASLLGQAFASNRSWQAVLVLILFFVGLMIQAGIYQREQSRAAKA